MSTTERQEYYASLCKELDDMFIRSGIREICRKCHNGEPYEHRAKHMKATMPFGCGCQKCEYVTPTGCGEMGLSCKTSLCSHELFKMLSGVDQDRFRQLQSIMHKEGWVSVKRISDVQ